MIEIAIDGTAASGKGTLAKKLAKKYGFAHLDTGLLYRKVANELIIKKKDPIHLAKEVLKMEHKYYPEIILKCLKNGKS